MTKLERAVHDLLASEEPYWMDVQQGVQDKRSLVSAELLEDLRRVVDSDTSMDDESETSDDFCSIC